MLFPSPFLLLRVLLAAVLAGQPAVRTVAWDELSPVRPSLEAGGLTAQTFPAYVERVRAENRRRVREGDLDHLVFYLLQSTRFTAAPPIEPALSAKALVDGLEPDERRRYLGQGTLTRARAGEGVRARIAALLDTLEKRPAGRETSGADLRLAYFASLIDATWPDRGARQDALLDEYLRVMRFVYDKEFVAGRDPRSGETVAALYRARGLSTDTAVEAGFLVHTGLGVVKALEPDRRIRRVLIVGPGLDLAPRTALREDEPPHSYQPWAVVDALVALGLSRLDDLDVVAADINPRVVAHLQRARAGPLVLPLASEIAASPGVSLTPEYRAYFAELGRAIGETAGAGSAGDGRLRKTVAIPAMSARVLRAELIDIVTERLAGPGFDLIVATNILPYFDDVQLALALANVAAMLDKDGIFLHNEARPRLGDLAAPLAMPFAQSRHAVIATVEGARGPLFDSVFLHRKR